MNQFTDPERSHWTSGIVNLHKNSVISFDYSFTALAYMGPPTRWLLRCATAHESIHWSGRPWGCIWVRPPVGYYGAPQPMIHFTGPGAPVGMYKVCGVQYNSKLAREILFLVQELP